MKHLKTYENTENYREFPIKEYYELYLKNINMFPYRKHKSDIFNFSVYVYNMLKNKDIFFSGSIYSDSYWNLMKGKVATTSLWSSGSPFSMTISLVNNVDRLYVNIDEPIKISGEITDIENEFIVLNEANKYNL